MTNNEDIQLVISATLAQSILNYLLRCPAGDVWTLVEGLRELPRAQMAPAVQTAPPGNGPSLASEGV